MRRLFAILGIGFAAACGPSVPVLGPEAEQTPCDPWAEVCTLSMSPTFGRSIAVDLPAATASGTETPAHEGGMASSLGRYLVLGTFDSDDQLCILPEAVDALEDIDVTQCQSCTDRAVGCWTSTIYFGLYGDDPGGFVGRALAAKTADGDFYRIHVLDDDASSDPAQLTFEYEGVR